MVCEGNEKSRCRVSMCCSLFPFLPSSGSGRGAARKLFILIILEEMKPQPPWQIGHSPGSMMKRS
jgi:hypothetical protein